MNKSLRDILDKFKRDLESPLTKDFAYEASEVRLNDLFDSTIKALLGEKEEDKSEERDGLYYTDYPVRARNHLRDSVLKKWSEMK